MKYIKISFLNLIRHKKIGIKLIILFVISIVIMVSVISYYAMLKYQTKLIINENEINKNLTLTSKNIFSYFEFDESNINNDHIVDIERFYNGLYFKRGTQCFRIDNNIVTNINSNYLIKFIPINYQNYEYEIIGKKINDNKSIIVTTSLLNTCGITDYEKYIGKSFTVMANDNEELFDNFTITGVLKSDNITFYVSDDWIEASREYVFIFTGLYIEIDNYLNKNSVIEYLNNTFPNAKAKAAYTENEQNLEKINNHKDIILQILIILGLLNIISIISSLISIIYIDDKTNHSFNGLLSAMGLNSNEILLIKAVYFSILILISVLISIPFTIFLFSVLKKLLYLNFTIVFSLPIINIIYIFMAVMVFISIIVLSIVSILTLKNNKKSLTQLLKDEL